MDQKKKYSTNRYRENHYNNEQPLKKLGRSSKNEAGVKTRKVKRYPVVNFFLFLTLVSSLAYFGITLWTGEDNTNFFGTLISSVIFVVFSILFIAICVSNPNRKKGSIVLGSFFLLLFNIYGSLTSLGIVQVPALGQVENFTGKSLTDVVSWASSNDITLNQDYEYSDMVPEYSIISQDIVEGTKIKDIDEITVAVSEGPNPDKEIIVPDMTSWDSERVINYVEDNYLNNVEVSFEESDQAEDTVIEQSESGSMRRSDKLELTFSLGEKANDSDVKIRDLTDMSEFAATFYLKQHRIHYEIERDFSKNINRGHVSEQSVKAGEMVKVNTDDEKVIITISRGRSITIPNLKKMSMVEITEWVIENKLKVEFTNRYDDSVKENRVIEANYDTGEKVEQGTTIEVVISKGSLVMRNFDSLEEFRKWADKYNISYEEKHEFSDDVPEGEIISFSYKKGDTIKNGDSIVVTISDGKECEVPDLIGMSRKEAIDALEEAELNYNFVTQNSNKSKNTVIKQSISAGSNVSKGTTITVTLSNGKSVEAREENSSGNSSSTSNSSSNSGSSSNSNGSSGNGNSNNSSKPTPDPEPVCNSCSIRSGELKNVILNNTGSFDGAANAVRNFITGKCPGVTVNISGDSSSGFTAGSYVSGFEGGSFSSCDTISITLAK
jgi:beta-lactam-binding protein with PASTA domain